MSNWISTTLIVPATIQQAANNLSAIIDPDTGGSKTFEILFRHKDTLEEFYGTQTMINPDYLYLISTKDYTLIKGALDALAVEYGRPLADLEDCTAFANTVICRPLEELTAVCSELGLERVYDV